MLREATELEQRLQESARLDRNVAAVEELVERTRIALGANERRQAEALLNEAAKRTEEGGAKAFRDPIEMHRAELKFLNDYAAAQRNRWNAREGVESAPVDTLRFLEEARDQLAVSTWTGMICFPKKLRP